MNPMLVVQEVNQKRLFKKGLTSGGAVVSISVVRVKSSAVPVTGASGSRSSWSTIIGDAEED